MTDYFQTTHITEQDVETLLDEYYGARGWDPETGNPTEEKLQELGLPTRSTSTCMQHPERLGGNRRHG